MATQTLASSQGGSTAGSVVIELAHVAKRYRGGGGVSDISLSIQQGEVFGFLGPNGAGKTTIIRLLLDLIRPNSGTIKIFGLDSRADSVEIHRRLGYIPGDLALYERFTPREILTHFAYLRGGIAWASITPLIDALNLEIDRPVRAMSKGNRQKVGLVAAFMGEPELLLLDEPTSGLDPLIQQQIHEQVRRVAQEGRTVFLSSHILSEVGEMAGRVGLIRNGRLVAVENVIDLQRRSAHLIDVTFPSPPDANFLGAVEGVQKSEVTGNVLHAEVTGDLNPLIARIASTRINDLSIREPGLEELFLSFYEQPHE
ncbi:MAG TPA: ABC transporter ATP-binding protein [Acidimicrobiales bacterium]|nr:ABC transporter ATP-binding protein [Acidimicrobiales bacterium]